MKNNYGNYVVQSALKLSKRQSKDMFVNNMNFNIDKMQDKKLINKWKGIIDSSIGQTSKHHRNDKKSESEKLRQNKKNIHKRYHSKDFEVLNSNKGKPSSTKVKSNEELLIDLSLEDLNIEEIEK